MEWADRLGFLLQASEVPKERLTGLPVKLLKLGTMALLLLLWPGPLLQTVSCDLEAHLQIGQRSKGVLQRGQEVLRVEGRVIQAGRRGRLCGADIRMRVVPHLAPPWLVRMAGLSE